MAPDKLKHYGITKEYLLDYLTKYLGYTMYDKVVNGDPSHYIKFFEHDENTPVEKEKIVTKI